MHLDGKGYEIFLPTYRVRRRRSDRMKLVVLPLFEGYIFCRLDLTRTARVVTTPGVVRLVNVAGVPAAIDDGEIAALQRIVNTSLEMEPWPYLRIGERIRIESGALAGIEGILESVRGMQRIIVSVTLLQRSVAVELDRDIVRPVTDEARLLCTQGPSSR